MCAIVVMMMALFYEKSLAFMQKDDKIKSAVKTCSKKGR